MWPAKQRVLAFERASLANIIVGRLGLLHVVSVVFRRPGMKAAALFLRTYKQLSVYERLKGPILLRARKAEASVGNRRAAARPARPGCWV